MNSNDIFDIIHNATKDYYGLLMHSTDSHWRLCQIRLLKRFGSLHMAVGGADRRWVDLYSVYSVRNVQCKQWGLANWIAVEDVEEILAFFGRQNSQVNIPFPSSSSAKFSGKMR
jgi:hypothetical protein